MTGDERFQVRKDRIRKRLLKYTRQAFQMLPQMDQPRILDIGCGSGIPTLELARLSQGEVMGIDIDQPALDEFSRRIEEAGLTHRVRAVNCSILNMDFPDESFEIIWSEGSIYIVGFKRGLREWKRFLKPGGFMIIHDEKGNINEKLKQISDCGYEYIGHFILNENIWWAEYFAPLEKLIAENRTRDHDDPKILEQVRQAQGELDIFKKSPERNNSVYFILTKN